MNDRSGYYTTSMQPTDLGQYGRAGMQILGSIQVAAFQQLRSAARKAFYETEAGAALGSAHKQGGGAAEVRARVEQAKAVAEDQPTFRLERFLQRFVAEENWNRGITAVEQKRDVFAPFLEPAPGGAGGSLELDPGLTPPRFFSEVEFHLQPGGWEGYDLYGPVLSYAVYPHVFSRGGFAALHVTTPGVDIRDGVVDRLPRSDYERIYEIGCGSGSTTRWLKQMFPDAELTGCDLSAVQLKSGYTVAEKAGVPIHFKQRDGRHTGEADESFDLVVQNGVAHELPPKANIEVFKEIFRILKPGGDLLMIDPPPLRSVDIFSAMILDWDTDHREEPFFASALLSDWSAELSAIGFEVRSDEVFEGGFPWVLVASKPASSR